MSLSWLVSRIYFGFFHHDCPEASVKDQCPFPSFKASTTSRTK